MKDQTKYYLLQTYFTLSPFVASGTLEVLAEILTASRYDIIYLDDSHYGTEGMWDTPATGYTTPGWYYTTSCDFEYTRVETLMEAVKEVGSHDTSGFFIGDEIQTRGWLKVLASQAKKNSGLY